MDWKKFFIAFVAAFGFIFLFGFLWYGKLMHGAHQEVPTLWRTEADFGNHFSTLIFGHIVMAFFLTLLCARFVPGGGPGACATLAILAALIYAGADLITFAGTAADDQHPLRLDCRRLDPILDCRCNHRRDLQARFANDTLDNLRDATLSRKAPRY